MNRLKIAALFAAMTVSAIVLPASMASAQGDGAFPRERAHVIPWSFADYQPSVPRGKFTGLFIWHKRNTVHIETTDNHWFGDRFSGIIEIRGGTFDNVKGETDRNDTRFRQIAKNRIAFTFRAEDRDVPGFKFNIHEGGELVIHIALDNRRTGRIFYGGDKAPTREDPVVFDLNK